MPIITAGARTRSNPGGGAVAGRRRMGTGPGEPTSRPAVGAGILRVTRLHPCQGTPRPGQAPVHGHGKGVDRIAVGVCPRRWAIQLVGLVRAAGMPGCGGRSEHADHTARIGRRPRRAWKSRGAILAASSVRVIADSRIATGGACHDGRRSNRILLAARAAGFEPERDFPACVAGRAGRHARGAAFAEGTASPRPRFRRSWAELGNDPSAA